MSFYIYIPLKFSNWAIKFMILHYYMLLRLIAFLANPLVKLFFFVNFAGFSHRINSDSLAKIKPNLDVTDISCLCALSIFPYLQYHYNHILETHSISLSLSLSLSYFDLKVELKPQIYNQTAKTANTVFPMHF